MNTCNRCGKTVGQNEWDIHTCTPKPGLCDDCETVSHCLKHGCISKHQALEQMAHNARELGLDYESPQRQWVGLTCEQIQKMAFTAVRENDGVEVIEKKPWVGLTELEKDAPNLLFALHDAWPYVHQWCTIESRKKNIQALMRKHGDFADTFKEPPQRQWVDLTDAQVLDCWKQAYEPGRREHDNATRFAKAIEAKLKELNKC